MSMTQVVAETAAAAEPSVISIILAVIKDTYMEALIIAMAMVFYMRFAKLVEPHLWRVAGYKQMDGDAVVRPPQSRKAQDAAAARQKAFAAQSIAQQAPIDQRIGGFFAKVAKNGAELQGSEILDQYEQLVRVQRVDLAEQVPDRAVAAAAFAVIAELTVQAAESGAKSQITRLLGDMRTFGFVRGRDLYATIIKALIHRQFPQDVLWLHDVMVADGFVPDRAMLVCLLNAAIACGQDQKAVTFFKDICKAGNPSMRTVMTVMRIFAKSQDWCGAVDALDSVKRAGGEPDALALNTVLGICIAANRLDMAERLSEEWSTQVDTISCNILLKGYAKKAAIDQAEVLFARMLSSGPPPNIISFNTMMDCSVRALQETTPTPTWSQKPASDGPRSGQHNRTQRAWELLDQLDKLGLEPDRYTCSTLVKGMHLTGCSEKDIDRAVALIKRIDLAAPSKGDDSNIRLLEVLFNSLLDACVNIRDLDRMAEIVSVMESCKVVVSAVTFGTLMKAFGHAGQLSACHEVWSNMRKAHVRPTIVTYGCYIDACIRNNSLDKADEIFKSMAKDGVKPNAVVYTTMIRGCAQAKQPLRALALYREMRSAQIEPTAVTFNSVLDIIARQLADTDSAKLQEVIDDMRAADVTPDAVTYSILMKASCNTGHVANAIALFRQLRKHGVVFDEVAYNTLLLACSKADNVKDAEAIFEEMVSEGTAPTLVTISILVKMYGKAKMLDKAIGLSRMLETKYGTKPNLYLFTCLIQACVRNRQIRKSWQVFGQMFTVGVLPDAIAYGTVVHGCVYHSRFEEAMMFVRHACAAPSSFSETKAFAGLLEIPSQALGQQDGPLVLQAEVVRALSKALRRKGQMTLLNELEKLTANKVSAPERAGAWRSRRTDSRQAAGLDDDDDDILEDFD